MKNVIAAFSDNAAAQQALQILRARGIDEDHVRILRFGVNGQEVIQQLSSIHVPEERAQIYAELMRRGAPVVVAEAEDDEASEIAAELDRMGSVDLDAAAQRWRNSGWSGYDAQATQLDEDETETERDDLERDSIGVVQEEVRVGKQQVERGGVRVRSVVTERPVHEQVQLREEHINVTRERVDEPIPIDATDSTFTEDEFVVTATGEEAVVGKEARVVERVRVDKTADVRTEEIDETERRRDVQVEQIESAKPTRRR